MSVNSSTNSSVSSMYFDCFDSVLTASIYLTYVFNYYILLVPLIILVLYFGYKQWRKQRSVAAANNMSHSDIITFNMVALELIGLIGCFIYCVASFMKQISLKTVGVELMSIIQHGQSLFHLFTCVDLHLAVVHPITYLRLRQRGGVRIRNINILCVWLLCFGSLILAKLNIFYMTIFSFSLSGFSCIGISFCSVSVLCVLIRPGPGEVGGKRERVDQSKLRAFYTIMAIMGVLFLRFFSYIISYAMYTSYMLNFSEICLISVFSGWIALPSILVLPLLFLHRAGKLPGCKRNTNSG